MAIERLPGATFHAAHWDNSVSFDGKRVGVAGSGALAIRMIPEVAKVTKELVVFQRWATALA